MKENNILIGIMALSGALKEYHSGTISKEIFATSITSVIHFAKNHDLLGTELAEFLSKVIISEDLITWAEENYHN